MQRINFNLKTLIITIFLILRHLTVISQEITYTYIDNTTFKDPLSLPYAPFESHPSSSYQANTFNYTESQYIPFEEERNRPKFKFGNPRKPIIKFGPVKKSSIKFGGPSGE